MSKILVIPDLHFPWTLMSGLDVAFEWAKENQPDIVIQIGDAFDQYTWSRFPRELDVMLPASELQQARELYTAMWGTFKYLCPGAELIQMLGNHDTRIIKQAANRYPEIVTVLNHLGFYKSMYGAEGVQLIVNPREILYRESGGKRIGFHHGDFMRTMVPGKRAQFLGESIVFGHTHRQWLVPLPSGGGSFEMCAGTLSDSAAVPLQYTAISSPWQVEGFGYIIDGAPGLVTL